jgi:hypothetical protein
MEVFPLRKYRGRCRWMIGEIGDDDAKGRAGPGRTIDNSRQFRRDQSGNLALVPKARLKPWGARIISAFPDGTCSEARLSTRR